MNQFGFCEVVLANGTISGWHIRKMFHPDGSRIPTLGMHPKSLCGRERWRDTDAGRPVDAYHLTMYGCWHCQTELEKLKTLGL